MPVPDTYQPKDTKAESKHLRAEDFPLDTKWTLKIADVNLVELDGRKKLDLAFVGKTKGLVLNATNKGFLEMRLGEQPNAWVGADLTLHRTTTLFEGSMVPAFRIIECSKGAPARREPGSDDF